VVEHTELAAHGEEVRRPAGEVAALELQGSRHVMLHIDGGEGVDEQGPTESPWVPREVGLLCAERVEPEAELVPDMVAAGGRCCGQGQWRQ
jgi:hypothetical protein